ncbi:MAG: diguanylate cyclase [Lachnospiraceae bacterium]|nr:diguanylate cyclase [Lachnospiraceae bacterium]
MDNITEKKRQELDRYLASVSCGILQYTLDTNEILYVNDRALEILGYDSLEEMQADNFHGVAGTVAPKDAGVIQKLVQELKDKNTTEVVECEYRVVHKDGQEIDCFGTLRILEGENGRPILQRSMVDITEAKRTEKLYKETTEILAGASMGLWYFILDEGEPRFIVDANAAVLIGLTEPLTEEETYRFWFDRVDKEYVSKVEKCVEAMRAGNSAEVIYPYHHPTRGVITVRCGGVLEQKYDGNGIMIRGYHQDITEYNEKLLEKELINTSIAQIYDTMHLLEIATGNFQEVGSSAHVREIVKEQGLAKCQEVIWEVMRKRIAAEHFESVKDFTTLSTLEERMRNTCNIQMDAINVDNRWFRFGFIRIGKKEDKLEKVLFVSQDIDDSKRWEENLITMSNTDNLTGLFNRNAYAENVESISEDEIGQDLWFIGLDVNNLKHVNDTLGHQAGDEIICAAADCLKLAFCNVGQVYRMGGDEFQVVLRGTETTVKSALQNMEKYRRKWRGDYVAEFTISKGMVCSSEFDHCTIEQLSKTADDRMYEEKKLFHSMN